MTEKCVNYLYHPVDCDIIKNNANITSITTLFDNKVAISSSGNHYPITIFSTVQDEKTKTIKLLDGQNIKIVQSENIKFIGTLKGKIKPYSFIIIPKHTFKLIYVELDNNIKLIVPDNNQNLRDYLVDIILNSNTNNDTLICKHKKCYHLVGFVELAGFKLIVQQICTHSHSSHLQLKKKQLFILNSTINYQKMTMGNTILIKSIDLISLFKSIKMNSNEIEKSIVTSVATNGTNDLNFFTTSGVHGRVWSIPYYTFLLFFGMPILKIKNKIKYSAIGITYVDLPNKEKQLMIICNNDKKITYGIY